MANHRVGKEPVKNLSLCLEQADIDNLKETAEKYGTSVSGLVRCFMDALDNNYTLVHPLIDSSAKTRRVIAAAKVKGRR